jgi:hypothetical protein
VSPGGQAFGDGLIFVNSMKTKDFKIETIGSDVSSYILGRYPTDDCGSTVFKM